MRWTPGKTCCYCDCCECSVFPRFYTAVVAGLADKSPAVSDCAGANGTYTLEFDRVISSPTRCQWISVETLPISTGTQRVYMTCQAQHLAGPVIRRVYEVDVFADDAECNVLIDGRYEEGPEAEPSDVGCASGRTHDYDPALFQVQALCCDAVPATVVVTPL